MGPRTLVITTLAAALATAALISGCGASNTVDPVARAADITARVPGYRVAANVTVTSPASGPIQMAMAGIFDRSRRTGSMSARETVAGRRFNFNEVFSGLTFYLHTPSSRQLTQLTGGRQWLKFDMSRMLGAMGLGSLPTGTDPSQFVDFLRAVSASTTKLGTQTVRGVATTHYRVKVDLSRYPRLVPAAQRAAAQRSVQNLQAALGSRTMPMEAWIDHSNLVRRLSMSFNECVAQQHVQFAMAMDLYDYGPQTQPQLPGAKQAYDITPLLSAELAKFKLGCGSG